VIIAIAADASKTFAAGGLYGCSPAVTQWLRLRAGDKSFHTCNDLFSRQPKGFDARAHLWRNGGGEDVMDLSAAGRQPGWAATRRLIPAAESGSKAVPSFKFQVPS
jgi:hypothetical protein